MNTLCLAVMLPQDLDTHVFFARLEKWNGQSGQNHSATGDMQTDKLQTIFLNQTLTLP